MGNMIIVGMADSKVTKAPGVLTTLGLGSCIGIALYDPITKVAGLAHIMLPDSTQITNNSNPNKFADTGIEKTIFDMTRLGASKMRMKAKIAGGAQMFSFSSTNESMRIGDRNIEATTMLLKKLNIPLLGQDTGSNYGRTVELDASTGAFLIKTISKGNKIL